MLLPADPDVSAISLPPNMNVPKDFPAEAWSPSGEVRSYPDMMVNFPAAGFSMEHPPAEVNTSPSSLGFLLRFRQQSQTERAAAQIDIKHLRRGYYAAASFTDANIGRVIDALVASGPQISENTISLLWSDQ